jgi:TRAP-type C4-dicarboxylate transport system substrate-binding protein
MLKLLKGTAVAGAAVVALTASATVSQAQEVTLRMHTFIPPVANPSKTFLIPWAERIGKESNGRIKVQPFWAMQLGGKVPQLLDQAKDGVVDIVWTLPGFTPGRMPRVEPFELPFVHKDALSSTLALQDFQEMHLGPDLKDYQTLLVHVHDGFLFQTKEPILKLEDLKGKKIRAASRGGVWLLEALGAANSASLVQGCDRRRHAALRDCAGGQDGGIGQPFLRIVWLATAPRYQRVHLPDEQGFL